MTDFAKRRFIIGTHLSSYVNLAHRVYIANKLVLGLHLKQELDSYVEIFRICKPS